MDQFDLDDIETCVPIVKLYAWLDKVMRNQGVDEFFACTMRQLELKGLCEVGEMAVFAPDLLTACHFGVKRGPLILTNERLALEIDGPTAKVSWRFFDAPRPGRQFVDFINLGYILNGFRCAGGPDWSPLEIHLQSDTEPDFSYLFPGDNTTRILLGQSHSALVFRTEILTASMLDPVLLPDGGQTTNTAPRSLIRLIESRIETLGSPVLDNMNAVANDLGVSTRTLRRHLAGHATSFREIVDNWRLKEALTLLQQENYRINENGERLGYANTPNFVRAFRRRVGCSPGAYRDAR